MIGKVTKFHRSSITTSGATEKNLTGETKSAPHPHPTPPLLVHLGLKTNYFLLFHYSCRYKIFVGHWMLQRDYVSCCQLFFSIFCCCCCFFLLVCLFDLLVFLDFFSFFLLPTFQIIELFDCVNIYRELIFLQLDFILRIKLRIKFKLNY